MLIDLSRRLLSIYTLLEGLIAQALPLGGLISSIFKFSESLLTSLEDVEENFRETFSFKWVGAVLIKVEVEESKLRC